MNIKPNILEIENKTNYELNNIEQLELAAEITLEAEGFTRNAEISVIIVDNEEIRAINKKFRKMDLVTDVLSFPSYNLEPGKYDDLGDETLPIHLGDVAISIERAESQAHEYGHSLLRELVFLLVHSILHLLGYDHIEDETEMFKKQEDILEKIGITRQAL